MAKNTYPKSSGNSRGTLVFEAELWAADKMHEQNIHEFRNLAALLPKLLLGELRFASARNSKQTAICLK